MRFIRVFALLSAHLAFGVLLVSGVAKAIDVEAFRTTLIAWQVLPTWSWSALAIAVPTAEIGLAGLWFARIHPRSAALVAFGMVGAFSAVYTIESVTSKPPDCGCFGLLARHFERLDEAKSLAVRNGIMVAFLLCGAMVPRSASRHAQPVRGSGALRPSADARDGPRGFSLIETLLVIAIIAVLLSLVLPALGMFRGAARSSVSLSQLRSHSAVFATYNIDWRDRFPYFTDPKLAKTEIVVSSLGRSVSVHYFGAHGMWNYVLGDAYYNGRVFHDSFYPPSYPLGRTGSTPYYYGCSFLARSDYWDDRSRRGPEQWGPTNATSVGFPAQKALLVAQYPMRLELPSPAERVSFVSTELAMVDGSAKRTRLSELTEGYSMGDGVYPGSFHYVDYPFGMHTRSGIAGIDVEP